MTSSTTVLTSPKPSFSLGEVSKLLYGRPDLQRYDHALAICKNFVVRPQGGLTRRPPTAFVREAYETSVLVPFEFNQDDAAMLELGDEVVRFFRDGGLVLDGETPYEVAMPYQAADLERVRKIYSGDVIYLAHPARSNVQQLQRFGDLDWRLSDLAFVGGPFLDPNTDPAATIKASAATGAGITLTANGFSFDAGHVGALWKLGWAESAPGIVKITAVTPGGATATADVIDAVPTIAVHPSTTSAWQEGAYSSYRGFPSVMTIFQQRLYLGKDTFLDGSALGDFNDFTVDGSENGGVRERVGVGTQRSNDMTWLSADLTLLIGTAGEEFSMSASSLAEAITAINLKIDPATGEGSIPLDPVKTGDLVFASRNRRRALRIYYDVDQRRYVTEDLALAADHMTAPAIRRWAWQRDPLRVLWIALTDGRLVSLTYNKASDIIAWAQHDVGGLVEDVAVIPSSDNADDEVWLIVRRDLNGNEVRHVERMLRPFDPATDTEAAAVPFLDCQISLSSETPVENITGLDMFEGMRLGVVIDGSYYADQLVSLGLIALPTPGREVTVGLPMQSHARLLPSEAQLRDGPSTGRMRRVMGVLLRYFAGPGGLVGDIDNYDQMEAIGGWDGTMDQAPQVAEGLQDVNVSDDWSAEDFLDIVVEGPFAFDLVSAPRLIEMGGQ